MKANARLTAREAEIAVFLLAVILPHEFQTNKDAYRIGRTSQREVRAGRRSGRRSEYDFDEFNF